MADVIQKGQCWQIGDDEDDYYVWIRGVDGDRIFVADQRGGIHEWSRDSLLEDGHEVEDD